MLGKVFFMTPSSISTSVLYFCMSVWFDILCVSQDLVLVTCMDFSIKHGKKE